VIVRKTRDSLQLITQPDHAHLAGAIMQHSVALASHPRRTSILLAIAEHDNGWKEPDSAPLIDPATGIPLDFISAPNAVRQAVWPRGVARLAHDAWAAALVAQHAIAIFDRYRGDSEWAGFFAEMERMRSAMLEAGPVLSAFAKATADRRSSKSEGRSDRPSIEDLLADYRFVGLGDVISLTFCNGWTDEQRFDTWRIRLTGSHVSVLPDLFGGSTVPFHLDAREIRQQRFRTDAELRAALAAAPAIRLEGVISATA
jgi:hypothetical protein